MRSPLLRLLLGGWLVCCLTASGQTPIPYVLTEQDFPLLDSDRHEEAFDIETDQNGFVYFVNTAGVHRFNGNRITKLKLPKSLPSSSFIGMFKDARGRIWVRSYEHGIGRIEGDSVVAYQHAHLIKRWDGAKLESLYMDDEGTLHLAPAGAGYLTISADGQKTEVWGRSSDMHGTFVTHLKDGTPFHFTIQKKARIKAGVKLKLYYFHGPGACTELLVSKQASIVYMPSLVQHRNGSYTISLGNNEVVTAIKDSLISHRTLPHIVLDVFEDSRGQCWLGTLNHGLHRALDTTLQRTVHFLDSNTASVTAEDPNGGLWIKSNDHLFHYIPYQDLHYFGQNNQRLRSDHVLHTVTGGDRVYFLLYSGTIAVFESDTMYYLDPPVHVVPERRSDLSVPIRLFYDTINNHLYCGYWERLISWDGSNWHTIILDSNQFENLTVLHLEAGPDGNVTAMTKSAFFHIVNGEITDIIKRPSLMYKMDDFAYDAQGTIWIGTSNGLWTLKGNTFQRPELRSERFDPLQQSLGYTYYGMDRVWVLGAQAGLMTIHRGQVTPVVNREGEAITTSECIFIGDSVLWGRDQHNKATLYSIRDSAGQLVVTRYSFGDHAAKFEYVKKTMGVAHGKVYFGTKGGIFRTPIDDLRSLAPIPHVHVREVYARQQLLPHARHHNLCYDQNSIYLLFEAISFEHTPVQIRCQLVGFDQEWQLPKYDALQYTNLDPGDYRFLVQARADGEPWGPLETISFHIETPYWKTWWFVLTVIVLGLVVIGSSFRLWYRAQRRRTTLLIEKAQAEQRALRAQMNPHFIFNALSSIQDLVFNENRMFAVTNIALFARLMRKILAHSSRENVTLTEEIETLTLYLKLESLRFEDRFHFEVSVAEGIDQDSRMLPPLFIQPFAENAIKHGLLNKQPAGGELLIHFRQQGGALLCTIEDNGVGRARAAELRSQRNPAHRSFSTHSVNERIRLLNAQRTNTITLNIVDLYDAEQQPCGTRIELLIPPKTTTKHAISHYR